MVFIGWVCAWCLLWVWCMGGCVCGFYRVGVCVVFIGWVVCGCDVNADKVLIFLPECKTLNSIQPAC